MSFSFTCNTSKEVPPSPPAHPQHTAGDKGVWGTSSFHRKLSPKPFMQKKK